MADDAAYDEPGNGVPHDGGVLLMPPERGGLNAELLREYLEEARHNTSEVLGLRNDLVLFRGEVGEVKAALGELVRAIRGGPAETGLVATAAVISERLKRVEDEVQDLHQHGTPASRLELKVLGQRMEDNTRRILTLEARPPQPPDPDLTRRVVFLERAQKESPKRLHGAINTAIALAAAVLALLALVFHR